MPFTFSVDNFWNSVAYCIPDMDLLPPAGRLRHCAHNWQQVTQEVWVVRTIQGCMLDLLREPSQRPPPMVTITSGQTQISEEIERLLEKQAIRKVSNQNGQFLRLLQFKKGWLTPPSGKLAPTKPVHQEGEVKNGGNDDGEEHLPDGGQDGLH